MSICHTYPFSVPIACVVTLCFSSQMFKRKRVSADPQGVQTRYLEKVVIHVKSDRSGATEKHRPNYTTLYPYSTSQTPIRTAESPALGIVYDINSKFELLHFCMCLTFSLVWKLISDESPCSKDDRISRQYWALHCSCQYLLPFVSILTLIVVWLCSITVNVRFFILPLLEIIRSIFTLR